MRLRLRLHANIVRKCDAKESRLKTIDRVFRISGQKNMNGRLPKKDSSTFAKSVLNATTRE